MERLNKEGLAYYHSLIKGMLIKTDLFGIRPTVKVRPGKPWGVIKRDVYLTYNTEDYTGEVSLDPSDDAITVKSWSDNLKFIIKCDSKAEAEALLDNGYSFRLSFLSRKYGSPKWVCPSNLSKGEGQTGAWVKDCPQWDKIPLTTDTCSIDKEGNITISLSDVRSLMTAVDSNLGPCIIREGDVPAYSSVDEPILEKAMLLGTEQCKIYNKAVFRKGKKIRLKGVLPYLQDMSSDITSITIANAPTNAYSFKIKAAVWYHDQELPGASIGCFVVTKKKILLDEYDMGTPVIQFKYKEEINNFK